MEQLLLFLAPLIETYAGSQGWLVSAISIMGSLRLFIKPLMSLLNAYVLITPSEKDDLRYKELEGGNLLKTLNYILDWFSSIKIKPKK